MSENICDCVSDPVPSAGLRLTIPPMVSRVVHLYRDGRPLLANATTRPEQRKKVSVARVLWNVFGQVPFPFTTRSGVTFSWCALSSHDRALQGHHNDTCPFGGTNKDDTFAALTIRKFKLMIGNKNSPYSVLIAASSSNTIASEQNNSCNVDSLIYWCSLAKFDCFLIRPLLWAKSVLKSNFYNIYQRYPFSISSPKSEIITTRQTDSKQQLNVQRHNWFLKLLYTQYIRIFIGKTPEGRSKNVNFI